MSDRYQMWIGLRNPTNQPGDPCAAYASAEIQPWIEALSHEYGNNAHELVARAVLSRYCNNLIARYQRNPRSCFISDLELVPRADPNEIYIRTQGTSVLIKVPHTQGPW